MDSSTTYSSTRSERAAPRRDNAQKSTVPGGEGIKITRCFTILRPAAELYGFWRQFENLNRIVGNSARITAVSGKASHWAVRVPFGDECAEWTAEIFKDVPNALLAWRSLEGADIANAGTVRFEPAADGEGTEVIVQLDYDPPGGKLAAKLAKFLSKDDPRKHVTEALRRFKALMEAGEIPTTRGQPVGEPQRSKQGNGA